MSASVTHVSWVFPSLGTHYAYVNAGETIAAASSAQGRGNGQIRLTAPDGTVYTTTVGSATVGQIVNRAGELSGPFVGYTPFTQVAGAGQGGLWRIDFLPTGDPSTVSYTGAATTLADAAWSQPNPSSAIAAWDVSVSNAGTIVPGRVYANVMDMFVNNGNYYGKLYVQTNDGYTYKVNNNGQAGAGFVFFVNNKGITNGSSDAALPTYQSFNGTTGVTMWNPTTPDGAQTITQKIFYALPDAGLPASAPLPGGSSTWLKVPKIAPAVNSIVIEGVEGTPGQVSSKGANIKFNASVAGTYRISLIGSGSFVTRTMTGSATAGSNVVYWDGQDGAGVAPSLGTASITANIQLQGAEVHFPFMDVENNVNGIVIEQLNDDGTVKSDFVFWDDTNLPTATGVPNPKFNGNTGSGISSNTNGHKWSGGSPGYGDGKTMDTWTYVLGDVASTNTTLNIRRADLAVQSVTPSSPVTQVAAGQSITYNIPVVNNGPSDVTGAPFMFKVPAGFTIASLSDITITTSCGAVNSAAIDASGNYTALLDLPNGCLITFGITGTPGASLAGGSLNMEASIMRPNDVTDPDATNPDAAVPPTDPHIECENGTGTESCNNIKYNSSVSVTASADIVTVKSTAATNYVPGNSVTYNITVTNNGPSDAADVNIIDNAPAGTTISGWTAVVTTGIVTLPTTSGTGNLNEIIATLPNGAVVTYTVTVDVPSDYNSNLVNTATITSTTPDPVPACTGCTTPPLSAAPKADLVTVKSTSATDYVPGQSVTYTITVTNNGPSDAADVNIIDNAPAGTTISAWTAVVTTGTVSLPTPSGTGDLNEIIATLPNGAVITYTVTVDVPSDYNSSLVNTASVTGTTPDPVPACTGCTTPPLSAAPKADLVTVKSTSATDYVPGQSVTYTIAVTNNGPSDAANVNIVDAAPAGTTISSWTAVVTTGTVTLPSPSGTGNLNEIIATLPNGAVVTYTVTVAVPSDYNNNLVNTATVTSTTPDPVPACTGCTTPPLSAAPKADIVTVKSTSATDYVPGQSVTYTITVTNNGPSDAADVNIIDNAPAGTTISSWTAAVTTGTVTLPTTSGTGDLNETIATLPNGAVVTYTVTVAIPSNYNSNLVNTATVTSTTPDPAPACTGCTTPPLSAAPKADLVTVKSTSATEYVPGQSVTYTITVTNNGPSDAADVNIIDNAPAGTTISSWTAAVTTGTVSLPSPSGTGNLNEIIATLPNGAVVTYTVTVAVPSDYNSNLVNTATVTSTTPDPVPACTGCTTPPLSAAPKADLVTVKSTSATDYVPGQSVTYTITVTNNGPSDAADVNIIDNAPAGTTISSWTAVVTTGTVSLPTPSGTGDLNEIIATLPNGAVVTYTVTVAVPSDYNNNLVNTATVTSTTPDPVPACTGCTTPPLSAAPKADLVTVKSTSATDYVPGQSVTYTITVTNNGPSDAADVNIIDNAPAGTTISSWTAVVTTGTVSLPTPSGTGDLNETIATLPNGAVVTYTVTVDIPSNYNSNLVNTATVTSTTPDPVPACTGCTTPPLSASSKADIVTVKSTSATDYVPGQSVTYTITVTNNGPSDAADVNIIDNAPAGTTISSWTAAVTTGTVSLPSPSGTGNLNEIIATLPNGAVVTYTVTVDVPSDYNSNLVNTATVTSTTPDPVPACTGCTTPPLSAAPKADLVTVKSTSATDYVPGQSVTYTITVTNNGPSDAADVNIIDNAPAGTTISSWTAVVTTGTVSLPTPSGTGDLNEIIATLPNGAVVTYTVTVAVPSDYNNNLVNTATVTSTTPDPVPACTGCTTPPLSAAPKADLVTVKSTSATDYVPGQSVTYTITVTNNGPSDAADVNIIDNAPAGTTISSWTAAVTTGTVSLPSPSGTGDLNETIATLPNGAVVTYTVTVAIPSNYNSNLVNTATVTSTTPDPVPACTGCTTPPLSAAPKADLVTVKSTSATDYVPGQSVTYTITVTNNGPSDAANVNVQDAAPAGTNISSWTAAVTTGTVTLPTTSGTGDLNETIATLPNGAVVTYTVTVAIPSNYNSNLVNTATVTSTTPDPVPACTGCTTPPLSASSKADIVTVKSTSATDYVPGQSVTYTITVTNNGPSDAADVNIIDNAPAGTTISSWTAAVTTGTVSLPSPSGTGNLNEIIATLPNGAVVTYTVTVDIPSNYNSNLVNTATVTSTTPDPVPACTGCTTPPLSASSKADLVTVKSTSATDYVPGQSVTYTITVTNNGPSDAADVNIIDNAPAGTTISSWTAVVTTGTVSLPTPSGTGDLNEIIATLPNGAVVTYTVTVAVPSDYNNNLVNTATVTSTTPDPVPACTGCTTPPLSAAPKADLVTVKSTSATDYVPGQSVTYTITVTNNGPSDAADVNIIDNAPAGTTISSWTAAVTTGTVTLPTTSGTGDLNETIATLPNGAVVTYTVTVAIPSNYNSNLVNTATVTSTTPDPVPACTGCTTPPLSAAPKADLVTVKSTSATDYVPGQSVTYTITVTNNGPSDAADVNIIDNAPAGTTISSWTAAVTTGTVSLPSPSGTGDLNEIIATLPNGAVVTYTVTVAIPSNYNNNLVNTATVTSTTPDPVPACTGCTTPPLSAASKADIVTVKSTSATDYVPGQSVIYTITVTNNGPSDATTVKVLDNAPAGTTISSWTAAVTTGTVTLPATSGTGNLNETIATLPNGAVVTYSVTVNIPSGYNSSLVNTASVTSTTPDPVPACTGCTTPPLSAASKADLVTVKSTSATDYVPGQSVTYTITVTNNGPSDAADVNIIDNAPAGTTISSWTAAVTTGTVTLPTTSGTGNLNEIIATLPNGAVVTYTVTVDIPSNYNSSLVNTATVTSTTPDPVPACNSCTTAPLSPVVSSADIVTVKKTQDAGQTTFLPGDDVIYTITVTNNGPSDATTVKVLDNAPAGTTISSWTAAVTTGTVTLPNTSGTGNLNETIATLPNGAAVAYTVTVRTPVDFKDPLSNTVTVTSATPDPVPACPACATPAITPVTVTSPPVATDDVIEGKTGNTVTISVLDNDKPGNGATPSPIVPSTIELITPPAHGTVKINADGTIVYTPDPGYYGEDTFTYRVQDEAGNWSNTATVKLSVVPNDLEIPNVITPNGDGNNDRFVIKGLEKYTQHEIIIFNRWNNMLYRSRNYQGDWEGKGLNAGTYYYTLKVQETGGQWKTYNGYIMLLR
ncbi:gliding motility-associated C-terminal domain-containing protein [Chitinophaga sp. GbtcB8]|uniref:T9SS type B sorting domain-containing protein n=1 Tax=Chitinophaga sp. GbtcB8 TaxID=2824753 RepID=UPI001C2FAF7D|nr:gliding motility-associated C-terminal domain-containing protein [Chitinophaga sp. GbtcB8]